MSTTRRSWSYDANNSHIEERLESMVRRLDLLSEKLDILWEHTFPSASGVQGPLHHEDFEVESSTRLKGGSVKDDLSSPNEGFSTPFVDGEKDRLEAAYSQGTILTIDHGKKFECFKSPRELLVSAHMAFDERPQRGMEPCTISFMYYVQQEDERGFLTLTFDPGDHPYWSYNRRSSFYGYDGLQWSEWHQAYRANSSQTLSQQLEALVHVQEESKLEVPQYATKEAEIQSPVEDTLFIREEVGKSSPQTLIDFLTSFQSFMPTALPQLLPSYNVGEKVNLGGFFRHQFKQKSYGFATENQERYMVFNVLPLLRDLQLDGSFKLRVLVKFTNFKRGAGTSILMSPEAFMRLVVKARRTKMIELEYRSIIESLLYDMMFGLKCKWEAGQLLLWGTLCIGLGLDHGEKEADGMSAYVESGTHGCGNFSVQANTISWAADSHLWPSLSKFEAFLCCNFAIFGGELTMKSLSLVEKFVSFDNSGIFTLSYDLCFAKIWEGVDVVVPKKMGNVVTSILDKIIVFLALPGREATINSSIGSHQHTGLGNQNGMPFGVFYWRGMMSFTEKEKNKNENSLTKEAGGKKHHVPKTFLDKFAYRTVKILRIPTDVFFQRRYGCHAIMLETMAAVPGMVGGMLLHLGSLHKFQRSGGWIKALLAKAENERMHLMTMVELVNGDWRRMLYKSVLAGVYIIWDGTYYNRIGGPTPCKIELLFHDFNSDPFRIMKNKLAMMLSLSFGSPVISSCTILTLQVKNLDPSITSAHVWASFPKFDAFLYYTFPDAYEKVTLTSISPTMLSPWKRPTEISGHHGLKLICATLDSELDGIMGMFPLSLKFPISGTLQWDPGGASCPNSTESNSIWREGMMQNRSRNRSFYGSKSKAHEACLCNSVSQAQPGPSLN